MDSGRLNIRVGFLRLVRDEQPGGGATETYEPFRTVWAQFSPERGREALQAGRIGTERAGVLRIRSTPDSRQIDGTFRVIIQGATYGVRGAPINPDQRHDMLEMIVEEVVAGT